MTEEKKQIRVGGVVRDPGTGGLGMTYGPTPTSPGKAADLLGEVREMAIAMQEAVETMASAAHRVNVLEAEVVEHASNASDLWHALYDLIAAVKDEKIEIEGGTAMLDAVVAGGEMMLRHEPQYRRKPTIVCPECAADKHTNCTKVVPVGDSTDMAPCACTDDSHVPEVDETAAAEATS